MSFFDGLNDGDRQEIGWHSGTDYDTYNVIRHQHREHAAVQRQVAQHGSGYVPAQAQSFAQPSGGAQTAAPPPGQATDARGDDGYARCELLVPKAAAAPVKGRKKDAEPTRRLREAMGLCRKKRQPGAPGLGQSREVRGSGHAPPPCM
eukprot:COSAG02_NODE_5491_length_4285_cov_191.599379_8_plen_147_part_01